jgi:hypothetical protein
MKTILVLIVLSQIVTSVFAQGVTKSKQNQDIFALIDNYSLAREKRDTVLLKKILMPEVDQLVSTGEWRSGIKAAVQGMMRSSATNPGNRMLTIDKLRFLNNQCAVVDAKYEIQNTDGSLRKMWSTFVVVNLKGAWKISAIRNMLPTEAR